MLSHQFYNTRWVNPNSMSISQYLSSVSINPYHQKYKTYAGNISVPIPDVHYCQSMKPNPRRTHVLNTRVHHSKRVCTKPEVQTHKRFVRNTEQPKYTTQHFTANLEHEILFLLESDEPCNKVDIFGLLNEWLALLLSHGGTSLVVLPPTALPF